MNYVYNEETGVDPKDNRLSITSCISRMFLEKLRWTKINISVKLDCVRKEWTMTLGSSIC